MYAVIGATYVPFHAADVLDKNEYFIIAKSQLTPWMCGSAELAYYVTQHEKIGLMCT